MNLEQRIIFAQNDNEERGRLIKEYMNFILSCAGRTLGRNVTEEDDACSVAMIAFDEAIGKYDETRGKFLPFAQLTIKNRLVDYLRKEYSHRNVIPFSSLTGKNDNDEEEAFEIRDEKAEISDAAIEIECISEELKRYDISFFDLAGSSPKSFKTKHNCRKIIRYIINTPDLIDAIKMKKTIPVKRLVSEIGANEKLLERHRKYIIAAVLILSGDYDILSGHLKFVKGGVI